MQIDLTGKTALITGGSKCLGLATALRMAESGARVAIVARDAAACA
jgi:NAD(P)-dependent dehydrogenase (short-subunit alcohol dehydrogenase family)